MIVRKSRFLKDPKPKYSSSGVSTDMARKMEELFNQTHNNHETDPNKLDTVGSIPDNIGEGGITQKTGKKIISAFAKAVNKLTKYDKNKNIRTDASKKYSKGATRKFAAKTKNVKNKKQF